MIKKKLLVLIYSFVLSSFLYSTHIAAMNLVINDKKIAVPENLKRHSGLLTYLAEQRINDTPITDVPMDISEQEARNIFSFVENIPLAPYKLLGADALKLQEKAFKTKVKTVLDSKERDELSSLMRSLQLLQADLLLETVYERYAEILRNNNFTTKEIEILQADPNLNPYTLEKIAQKTIHPNLFQALDKPQQYKELEFLQAPYPKRISYSPDGKTLAIIFKSVINFYDSEKMTIKWVHIANDPDIFIEQFAWHPDSNQVAYAQNMWVTILDINKKNQAHSFSHDVLEDLNDRVSALAYSPDGKYLAAGYEISVDDLSLALYKAKNNYETKQEVRLETASSINSLCWNTQSSKLFLSMTDGIYTLDVNKLIKKNIFDSKNIFTGQPSEMSISSNNRYLTFDDASNLTIFDTTTKHALRVIPNAQGLWSNDGTNLAIIRNYLSDAGIIVDIYKLTESNDNFELIYTLNIPDGLGNPTEINFSSLTPDGRFLAAIRITELAGLVRIYKMPNIEPLNALFETITLEQAQLLYELEQALKRNQKLEFNPNLYAIFKTLTEDVQKIIKPFTLVDEYETALLLNALYTRVYVQ